MKKEEENDFEWWEETEREDRGQEGKKGEEYWTKLGNAAEFGGEKEDYSDFYLWAYGIPNLVNNTPEYFSPSNWLSAFGGSAWKYDEMKHMYYYHKYLASQPDLNFHNENVVRRLCHILDFWIKVGMWI